MPSLTLTNSPDYGQNFNRALHDFIVLITGLDKKNVRPAFQFEPPKFGDTENWCSFSTPKYDSDGNFFERVKEVSSKQIYESRDQEEVSVRVSFYGPEGKKNSRIFVAGLKRTDFWETFYQATGCRMFRVDTIDNAPDMLDGHWISHTDVACIFRRETVWEYSGISGVSKVAIDYLPST